MRSIFAQVVDLAALITYLKLVSAVLGVLAGIVGLVIKIHGFLKVRRPKKRAPKKRVTLQSAPPGPPGDGDTPDEGVEDDGPAAAA